MAQQESTGFLHDDVPYLKVGQGPPLVMLEGLSPEHDLPKGFGLWIARSTTKPFANDFTVYFVNRKRGLRPGASMSDIAGHLAAAIDHDLGEPVYLQGTSTGGAVALQLALDRPDLVRRLVVTVSAYRLGESGRAIQADLAKHIRAGPGRAGWTRMVGAMTPLRGPLRPLAWLAAGAFTTEDPADLLITIDAEDAYDFEADLPRITAPTLVIGGTKDVFYSAELFERTAAGVQNGRVHLFEGWGHVRTGTASATAKLTLDFLRG